MKTQISQLISAKELAARYSVSAKTVRKWARTSLLPVVRLNCRCIRFDIETCDEVILKRSRIAVP
jgi:predicted site-specific integrase-resolvase